MSLIFSNLRVQGLALFSVYTAPDGLRSVSQLVLAPSGICRAMFGKIANV